MVGYWILYVVLLVVLVYTSYQLANFVDALDKKTKLSGAFLGGIVLAGVTSLPELVTSFTSSIMGEPGMVLGNILGSNVFDIAIIGVIMVIWFKRVRDKPVSRSSVFMCLTCLGISAIILILSIFKISIVIPYVNINIFTPVIIGLYITAIVLSRKNDTQSEGAEVEDKTLPAWLEKMSVSKITWLFIGTAVILIGASIGLTFVATHIANVYGIASGLAGALFLGIATSIPEVISTFQLVRLGNFDAGVGNIVGSCVFNFLVISLADCVYTKGTVFLTDLSSVILSSCLVGATICLSIYLLYKRKRPQGQSTSLPIVIGSAIVASYITFLVLSAVFNV